MALKSCRWGHSQPAADRDYCRRHCAGDFHRREASAIAVVYTLLLTMVFYRTLKVGFAFDFVDSGNDRGHHVLLATSSAMSFSMSITNIPAALSDARSPVFPPINWLSC